jgi:hypothetical protein
VKERTVFIGNGGPLYRGFLRESLGEMALFAPDLLNHPRGAAVARLGLGELERGGGLDLASFAPFYVRPSEAETKWREAHGPVPLSAKSSEESETGLGAGLRGEALKGRNYP